MKKIFLLVILVLVVVTVKSQELSYLELAKAESELALLFDRLYDLDNTENKAVLFNEIDSSFALALSMPGAFDYGWKKLDKIGKLKSDDGMIKVFSWLWMVNREDYRYGAYIQYKSRKGEPQLLRLKPGDSPKIKREDYQQEVNDWHAKIYYQIVSKEYKRKRFYTLVGADFNSSRITMKTIEVMVIQRGKPAFRGEQFLDGGIVKDRLVFQYSAELSASVRYNAQLDQIVFDHLAPLHPLYYGDYQFYGPDGSYDGLRFQDGIWVKEEDVDAKNQ